jgi:hypothetical protein
MKFFITIVLLMIPLYLGAQEFNESDLDSLLTLPGIVETYYSEGSELKARYLQELVQDAVIFYQDKLQDTFDIKLLVLNKKDWKLLVGGPYFLYGFSRDPDRIEMGVHNLFKIKLPEDETLYGKNEAFLWDFVAVHELGHYISSHKKVKGIRWTSEFFADYLMLGFLLEKIPDWKPPSSISTIFKYLPFKHKSLEDFGKYYSRTDPLNTSIYHAKFEELAFKIFEKDGWDFMYEYIDRYTQEINPPPDRNHLVEYSVAEFRTMEPEIFDEWLAEMRVTYHPLIIIISLLVLIVAIRSFDKSNRILSNTGLKTRKRYKILGVPTRLILTQTKHIENKRNRIHLMLIIGFRPIMYFGLLLFILLLILHH